MADRWSSRCSERRQCSRVPSPSKPPLGGLGSGGSRLRSLDVSPGNPPGTCSPLPVVCGEESSRAVGAKQLEDLGRPLVGRLDVEDKRPRAYLEARRRLGPAGKAPPVGGGKGDAPVVKDPPPKKGQKGAKGSKGEEKGAPAREGSQA